ncbi:MAG: TauD/TfdA family dioxygenase [Pseudomonadota bacterium]
MAAKVITSERRALGSVLDSINIGADITSDLIGMIQRALWQSGVLVIHGQKLEAEQLDRLGRAFGRMEPHSILHYRHPEFPELSYISNVDKDGKIDTFAHYKRAVDWHTDGSFKDRPDTEAFLYSLKAPTVGGATCFTDMRLAYDTLSPERRDRIAGLKAFHKRGEGWRTVSGPPPLTEEQKRSGAFAGAAHPVVITHPHTKRRSLYINPGHTSHIVGFSKTDSDALLDELYEHSIAPEFQYHHNWRPGDIVFWDQRSVMHKAGGGVPTDQQRIMIRGMMTGELYASA